MDGTKTIHKQLNVHGYILSYIKNTQMEYIKIVSKGNLEYMYFKIQIVFENPLPEFTAVQLKALLLNSVCDLFGEVGRSSVLCDILTYDVDSLQAVIRCPHCEASKFRSAITLCGSYANEYCAIHIIQVSNHLVGLDSNSRTYKHITV